MEALLTHLIAAIIGAGAAGYSVYRRLRAANATVDRQNRQLHMLRAQRNAATSEQQSKDGLTSTADQIAFDLMFLLDSERRIIARNESATHSIAGGAAIGKPLAQVLASPELDNLIALAQRESERLEEQLVIGRSNYRVRAQAIDNLARSGYVGVAMRDITDLVHLNRARRDLVANISHELRTPITRIRLIIEGLFLEADKPKRKASIQSLKEIATETDSLLWLAQELLDLSMIESGEAILRLVETPLNQVLDEATARHESQAETKNLKIVSHVPQTYNILCDADQLKRVLGNLLHNAIKWSPPNEAITITAAEREEEIVVTVFDNGPGVPDDVRERIFERFYQADVSHSGDDGSGLGLAICKHIVEAHGGQIWAEGNSQGIGGRFVFTVLKADANFQLRAAEAPASEPERERTHSVAPL